MAKNWYVVRTQFQAERRAETVLNGMSFSTYLPLAKVESRGRLTLKPFIVGYLFVRFDWRNDPWESIAYTPFVKEFVGYREGSIHPLQVRSSDMRELKSRVRELGGTVPLGSKARELSPGLLVEVLTGPFSYWVGTVDVVKGSRVTLLFDLLGAERPVTLARDCVAAAA